VVIGSAWYDMESKDGLEEATWKDLATSNYWCIIQSQVVVKNRR
jgi:hypothetical protein